jgi:hypothetical protein
MNNRKCLWNMAKFDFSRKNTLAVDNDFLLITQTRRDHVAEKDPFQREIFFNMFSEITYCFSSRRYTMIILLTVPLLFMGCQELSWFLQIFPSLLCFLSSLPLIPQATTAVFGSYLSSLYSLLTMYRRFGIAYLHVYDGRGFLRPKKKTSVDLLVFL